VGERIGSGPRSGFRVNEPRGVAAGEHTCMFDSFDFGYGKTVTRTSKTVFRRNYGSLRSLAGARLLIKYCWFSGQRNLSVKLHTGLRTVSVWP
jgi:hypothetical protein